MSNLLSSFSTCLQNSLTDFRELTSTCLPTAFLVLVSRHILSKTKNKAHKQKDSLVSTINLFGKEQKIIPAAFTAFSKLLQAKITLAPRRAKSFAVSYPIPYEIKRSLKT